MYTDKIEKYCFLPANVRVKDIDEQNSKVDIIVSSMGDEDSDGDVIHPGAFKKTIQEQGPGNPNGRIKHLLQHWRMDVIGRPLEMEEINSKLRVLSVLSNKQLARDIIEDYKLNLYEHSIGFEGTKSEERENGGRNYYEVALWEYSTVTWGANQNTPFQGFKSLMKKDPSAIKVKLNERMDLLINAIAKGDYTDQRFKSLYAELDQVKKLYNELIDSLSIPAEPEQPTRKEEKPNPEPEVIPEINLLNSFYGGFKSFQ